MKIIGFSPLMPANDLSERPSSTPGPFDPWAGPMAGLFSFSTPPGLSDTPTTSVLDIRLSPLAKSYSVKPNDSLSKIVKKHYVSDDLLVDAYALAFANGIANPDLIHVGDQLTLPSRLELDAIVEHLFPLGDFDSSRQASLLLHSFRTKDVDGNVTARLDFTEDGQVKGWCGSEKFTGTYDVDGNMLLISSPELGTVDGTFVLDGAGWALDFEDLGIATTNSPQDTLTEKLTAQPWFGEAPGAFGPESSFRFEEDGTFWGLELDITEDSIEHAPVSGTWQVVPAGASDQDAKLELIFQTPDGTAYEVRQAQMNAEGLKIGAFQLTRDGDFFSA